MNPRELNCPNCGKKTEYKPENAFRPFCSERCQLIDLGEWADGKYAVPVENNTPADDNTPVEDEAEDKSQKPERDDDGEI